MRELVELAPRFAQALAVGLMLVGCSTPPREPAVPRILATEAEVPGIEGVRHWVDYSPAGLIKEGAQALERESQYLKSDGHTGPLPKANFLAISGGGDNGAFGAGLLVGWTAAGTRPEFKIVTGVSTGALIAPFAFLGPEYDETMKAVYTGISRDEIFEFRGPLSPIFDDAVTDSLPLAQLVERYADQEMLDKIAYEYEEKGRFLLVGTANLDAQQAVIWNMGKIAASKDPRAVDLFRDVLVASAAVPGALPPVMIDVEAKGRRYQEMHVDGGTMSQVFLYPPSISAADAARAGDITRERSLFIIRNARLDPDWDSIERRTIDIVGRAIESLIKTQGVGDLYRIYLIAQRDEIDYNLAYIGSDFTIEHEREFDTHFMNELFDYGYALGEAGYDWYKSPPNYNPASLN